MDAVATSVAVLALVGAAVSWVAGVVYYLRTLQTIAGPEAGRLRWYAVVAWPFVLKRLSGGAAENAMKVNKALVAFFTCIMIAVAAISVATNLSRISR
ncbi:MAG TPA: hypothetical protein VNL39_15675 [Xanthobacteraceae bacterium]|nr:hypothetical protein [Xanthobacteraceae bacterium]